MPEPRGPAAVPPVPGNRWDLLAPPATDRPARTVSVCIPTRNGGAELHRTLHMLALQTFPTSNLEVVVADDGSSPPVDVDASALPYAVSVVRQEAAGFGAGRARNLAARTASGEILVFLDGDVIPEVGVIDEYVSWIERSPLCVPFGFSRFVELSRVDDGSLAEALAAGGVAQLVVDADVDSQDYREPYLERTRDLTVERLDLFRVFVAATFAVTADLFAEVGGFRELGVRGVEDLELGYRLVNHGALLVPARSARHWHQGRRTMSGTRLQEVRRARQPYVERLLPVGGFRPDGPLARGPVEPVCRFVAHVEGADDVPSVAAATVAAAPREDVQLASDTMAEQVHAFADVVLPADVGWSRGTAALLVDLFERSGVGTLKLVGDDHPPVVVRQRRATRRARAVAGAPSDELAEELFGVAVALAAEAGIVPADSRPGRRRSSLRRGRRWRRLRQWLARVGSPAS